MSSIKTIRLVDYHSGDEYDISKINISINTISDLLGFVPNTADTTVIVKGYHSINDGGSGVFVWDATEDKANHNGGTIIDPSKTFPGDWSDQSALSAWFTGDGIGSGCWKRIYSDSVNVKWFGAKGDGVTDEFNILKNIINLINNSDNVIIVDFTCDININTLPTQSLMITKPFVFNGNKECGVRFKTRTLGTIYTLFDIDTSNTVIDGFVFDGYEPASNSLSERNYTIVFKYNPGTKNHTVKDNIFKNAYFYSHRFSGEYRNNLPIQNITFTNNFLANTYYTYSEQWNDTDFATNWNLALTHFEYCENIVISNNTCLYGRGSASINVVMFSNNFVIENNIVLGGHYASIEIENGCHNGTVMGNICHGGALWVDDSQKIIVSNNYVRKDTNMADGGGPLYSGLMVTWGGYTDTSIANIGVKEIFITSNTVTDGNLKVSYFNENNTVLTGFDEVCIKGNTILNGNIIIYNDGGLAQYFEIINNKAAGTPPASSYFYGNLTIKNISGIGNINISGNNFNAESSFDLYIENCTLDLISNSKNEINSSSIIGFTGKNLAPSFKKTIFECNLNTADGVASGATDLIVNLTDVNVYNIFSNVMVIRCMGDTKSFTISIMYYDNFIDNGDGTGSVTVYLSSATPELINATANCDIYTEINYITGKPL